MPFSAIFAFYDFAVLFHFEMFFAKRIIQKAVFAANHARFTHFSSSSDKKSAIPKGIALKNVFLSYLFVTTQIPAKGKEEYIFNVNLYPLQKYGICVVNII